MKQIGSVLTMIAVVLLGIGAHTAIAQESVLYNFLGPTADGLNPDASLIIDAQGNLYGTTVNGGAHYAGAVFELLPVEGGGWTEQILYSFGSVANSADGQNPLGSLVFDKPGNLYGTTYEGGANSAGTVFELSPGTGGVWTEQVLHSFAVGNQTGTTDGSQPEANLIFDAQGNLYGTTNTGGIDSNGTVFELSPGTGGAWTERVLYNFNGNDIPGDFDGKLPLGGLIFDAEGNLYGTTSSGGEFGTAFELSPGTGGVWTEKQLWVFTGYPDGATPDASLVFDSQGNLYGTTEYGGGLNNGGTVFELSPGTGGAWTEKLLWTFAGSQYNGSDGFEPFDTLIFDAQGNLYGTTAFGGPNGEYITGGYGGYYAGTAFELTPTNSGPWSETILHSFYSPSTDGYQPYGGLVADTAGNLYGTTYVGGLYDADRYTNDGTVFEIGAPGGKTKPVITWPAPAAITYGTGLGGAELDATTNVAGTFSYSPVSGTVLPAGSQMLSSTFTPSDPGVYSSVTTTVPLTVNKALLTVKETPPQAGSSVFTVGYGDNAPYLSDLYTITGFVNGDGFSVVSGLPTVSIAWPAQPNVGTYPLTIGVGTLAAANYSFTGVGGPIGVTADPLDIKPVSLTRKYGEGLPTLLYNATGLAYGQTLASALIGTPIITTTASGEPPVGSYSINLSLAGLSTGANYTLGPAPNNATLTITPGLLNARATNVQIKYGAPLPKLAYTVTGYDYADNISVVSGSAGLTTTATANSAPGSYPITFATQGLSAKNYAIDYVGATLTILPK